MAEYDDIIRIGIVSSVHPEKHRVRVRFSDKDNLTSYELPMIVRGSLKNKMQHLPDPGEAVLCVFLPNGEEQGFCLGSFYSKADPPDSTDREEYMLKIPGGVCISIHRTNRTIQMVDSYGSKMIWADGDITFKSARNINLNPDNDIALPAHINALFD